MSQGASAPNGLVLVVDEDELTFDITGAEIDGTLANDAEVKIEAEDSPDGLVAITVVVKGKDSSSGSGKEEEDGGKKDKGKGNNDNGDNE